MRNTVRHEWDVKKRGWSFKQRKERKQQRRNSRGEEKNLLAHERILGKREGKKGARDLLQGGGTASWKEPIQTKKFKEGANQNCWGKKSTKLQQGER